MLRFDSMRRLYALICLAAIGVAADDNRSLPDRTRQYLIDLIKIDSSNPPGNETAVANYLKQVADSHAISCELMGNDTKRLNFVARLKGSGHGKPLLLLAHSDVVPADRKEWTVDPFSGEVRNGFIYGRGTQDAKSLLAAEIAVLVEIKRRNIKLGRDVILLAEADDEASATGVQWVVQHAYPKIEAEFALNEGGSILETKDGPKIFEVQTTEKIPMHLIVTAKGTAGDSSLPRADNAISHLTRALQKLSDTEQPVKLSATTRRYLRDISKVPEYSWLAPLIRSLDNPTPAIQQAAANQIRAKDPVLDTMLRTTVTTTMVNAGARNNVIPSTAQAQVDVRRLPNESRDDVLARFRQTVNDPAIEIALAPGPQIPATDPSPTTTALYQAMTRAIGRTYPRDVIVPFESRGSTDGSFLRAHGVPVYGVPVFLRENGDTRIHGNDERISPKNLEDGVELLWQIVLEIAGGGQ
jgi:acetylornithine deacetylase/succinyl-diaminopimelate desuccinylase-like protein